MLFLIWAVLMPAAFAKSTSGGGDQPNIIVIVADDLGYNDIGYNNDKVHTPVLNKLASEGRILTKNYVPSLCWSSPQALLTGRYEWRSVKVPCIPSNHQTLPEALKKLGYQTHMFGKWAVGYCQEACLPTHRGFDTYVGQWSLNVDHYSHMTVGRSTHYYDWHRGDQPDRTAIGKYSTKLLTTEAVTVLEQHDPEEGPFFMYIAHIAAHVPLQVEQEYIDLYDDEPEVRRRTYLGMVSALDEQTGVLMDALTRLGLKDNTLIVFSTDVGGEGVIGPSDNWPYRGGKGSLYEGGSRGVGFVTGKGVTGGGTRHDGLFASIDWFPTLVNIARGNADEMKIDGIDQTSMVLHGGKSKRENFVYKIDMRSQQTGNNAIRKGDFKLIWGYEGVSDGYGRAIHINGDPGWVKVPHPNDRADPVLDISWPFWTFSTTEVRSVIDEGRADAIMDPNDINSGRTHLFNLIDDPREQHDLAENAKYSKKVIQMKEDILRMADELKLVPDYPRSGKNIVNGTLATGSCDGLDISL